MARGTDEIKPLFDPEEIKKVPQPQDNDTKPADPAVKELKKAVSKESKKNLKSKYARRLKKDTHTPHNIRIPIELKQEIIKIGKTLGLPVQGNSGFQQDFTIEALRKHVADTKKELGIDD